MSAIGNIGSSNSEYIKAMLTRLDTNKDANISKDEFIAGSSSKAAPVASALYDVLDSSKSGSLSVEKLTTTFQTLSSLTQSGLLGLQEQHGHDPGARGAPPPPPPPPGGPTPDDLFAKVDANSDGTVTKEEFLANQPENVSEEEALLRWNALAGEDTESLSEDDFKTALKDLRPPPPPPPPPGGRPGEGGASPEDSEKQQLLSELLTALQSYQSSDNRSKPTDALLDSLFA